MSRDPGEFQSLRPYRNVADAPRGKAAPRASDPRIEAQALALRPRGVGELLDLAFELLRSRFGLLVGVSAVLWIPVQIAQPWFGDPMTAGGDPWAWLAGLAFNFVASMVVTILEMSFVILLAAAHLEGRDLSLRAAVGRALSRFFPLAVIALVSGFMTIFGLACFCLLSLPGLYILFKLWVAPAVCVLEGAGVGESLSRSFELSRGRFFAWFAVAGSAFCFRWPIEMLGGVADMPNVRTGLTDVLSGSGAAADTVLVLFSSLFNGVATAISAVVVSVWYFDCRVRREGIDIQSQLARMRGEAAVPAGAVP